MRKSVSVFTYDANPEIDPPSFHVSKTEAALRLEKGYCIYVGPNAVQMKPPPWLVP
jgi:hypothetical protein